MKATNELRFVERTNPHTGFVQKILQQKWAAFNQNIIVEQEWRDVPIEKEPKQ